jgi:hypothetical protein
MGNKIIIDEEVLAKISELIGDLDTSLEREGAMQVQQLILENSTTISIDDSIEDRAYKLINYNLIGSYELKKAIAKKIATEQSIISEIKSKGCTDKQNNCEHEWLNDKFDNIGIAMERFCPKCGKVEQL